MKYFQRRKDWGNSNSGSQPSAPRAFPAHNQPVTVQFIGQNSGAAMPVRDISETGVSIFVSAGFMYASVHEEQQFVIKLPNRPSFLVTGFVRHYRTRTDGKEHIGIEFKKISAKYQSFIRDFVNTRMEAEEKDAAGGF